MENNLYYNKKNPKFNEMELDEKGYPIWKDSKKLLHRYVAEKLILRRELKGREVVHHVDGDKLNFHPNNLIVLNSKEDHEKIERDMWKYTNVMVVHFIVILYSYLFLVAYLYSKNIYLISATLFLLFIALIIPVFPKTLRKILFKLRILKKSPK